MEASLATMMPATPSSRAAARTLKRFMRRPWTSRAMNRKNGMASSPPRVWVARKAPMPAMPVTSFSANSVRRKRVIRRPSSRKEMPENSRVRSP
ncbi:hypothetical protein D9M72_628960 [compost metagenome]